MNFTWVVVKIRVPFWGTPNDRCRIILGTQKRDHNFDNHPHVAAGCIYTVHQKSKYIKKTQVVTRDC